MTYPALPKTQNATPALQPPRARGLGKIVSKMYQNKSVLADLHQAGSTKVLFPRPVDTALQAVVINTAGGVTGGDHFTLEAHAQAGTTLTLTTQTAERAYRAQAGQTGALNNQLKVGETARMNWLPQETILFDGCSLNRSLSVDLAQTSCALICETLVFGRAAMGEVLNTGKVHDRLEVRREGKPIFLDAIRLEGDIARQLAHPAGADGAGAVTSLIYVAPDAEAHLTPIRATLGPTAGVSLIAPDLLFLRILAPDSFLLRQTLIPILSRLTGGPLPRPWMI